MNLAVIALATLIAVIALIVFAEIIARFWVRLDRRYFISRPYSQWCMYMLPDASPYLKTPIWIKINSNGERSPELPRTKGRIYRVLVVGGSFAECGTVTQEKIWSYRLESILRQNLNVLGADEVHVANIGTSGIVTSTLASTLEVILPRYPKMDLILIATGVPSALDWLLQGAPAGQAALPSPAESRFAQYPGTRFHWLKPNRTGLTEVYRRLSARFGRPETLTNAGRTMTTWGQHRAKMKPEDFTPLTSDASGMLAEVRSGLSRSLELCEACAERVIVVRIPWLEKEAFAPDEERYLWAGRIGQDKEPKNWRFISYKTLCNLISSLDQTVVEVARDHGLEDVDMRTLLPAEFGIYYDQFHVTEDGAALVAQHLAATILRQPLVIQ